MKAFTGVMRPARTRLARLAVVLLAVGLLPAVAGAASAQVTPGPTASAQETAVVWVVRHAERADDGAGEGAMLERQQDPGLSAAGRERAQAMSRILADVELDRILSTDYRRTRATADPVAAAHGVVVESYDPRDLTGLARQIRAAGGHWLVVGHSNTTPQLVAALGGEPGAPIGEFEYDRLYQVVVLPDGSVETTLLRFGS